MVSSPIVHRHIDLGLTYFLSLAENYKNLSKSGAAIGYFPTENLEIFGGNVVICTY